MLTQNMASPAVSARGQTRRPCASTVPVVDTKTAAPFGTAVPWSGRIAYAAVLNFSTATATRFDSGWNASPASFSEISAFFDAWATMVSNADLA